ncbi:hypothetical protein [Nonomuraea sp. NPDC023979]|uniref:hypothetical protein n=1 Tax=Nonomuraea sp. NPDC023979 TaxID=3154796 RepID=UPI003400D207
MTDAMALPPYDPELLVADRTLFTPVITDHEVFQSLRSAPEMTIDMFQEYSTSTILSTKSTPYPSLKAR